MRFMSFLFLILFAGVVGVFAYQNQQEVTVTVLDFQWTRSFALFAGAIFLLGMLSGWSIVGLIRRSVYRVTHEDPAAVGNYAHR